MRIITLAFALLFVLALPVRADDGNAPPVSQPTAPMAEMATYDVPDKPQNRVEKLSIVTVDGKRHKFDVEIVSQRETMARGLMFRPSMNDNYGMLFVFAREGMRGFWMENTFIALDIIFVAPDGKIRNIGYGKPESKESVYSDGPVMHVLELNAGTAERLGIKPGDTVHHEAFGNALEP